MLPQNMPSRPECQQRQQQQQQQTQYYVQEQHYHQQTQPQPHRDNNYINNDNNLVSNSCDTFNSSSAHYNHNNSTSPHYNHNNSASPHSQYQSSVSSEYNDSASPNYYPSNSLSPHSYCYSSEYNNSSSPGLGNENYIHASNNTRPNYVNNQDPNNDNNYSINNRSYQNNIHNTNPHMESNTPNNSAYSPSENQIFGSQTSTSSYLNGSKPEHRSPSASSEYQQRDTYPKHISPVYQQQNSPVYPPQHLSPSQPQPSQPPQPQSQPSQLPQPQPSQLPHPQPQPQPQPQPRDFTQEITPPPQNSLSTEKQFQPFSAELRNLCPEETKQTSAKAKTKSQVSVDSTNEMKHTKRKKQQQTTTQSPSTNGPMDKEIFNMLKTTFTSTTIASTTKTNNIKSIFNSKYKVNNMNSFSPGNNQEDKSVDPVKYDRKVIDKCRRNKTKKNLEILESIVPTCKGVTKNNVSKVLECAIDFISKEEEINKNHVKENSQDEVVQFCVQHMAYDFHFLINSDGKIVYTNLAACSALGYDKEELNNLSIDTLVSEKSLNEFRQLYYNNLKGRIAFLHKSGAELNFEIHFVVDLESNQVHVIGRESIIPIYLETKYFSSLGTVMGPNEFFSKHSLTGITEFASENWALCGFRIEGKSAYMFAHEADIPHVSKCHESLFVFEKELSNIASCKYRIWNEDKQIYMWMESRVHVCFNDNGDPKQIVSFSVLCSKFELNVPITTNSGRVISVSDNPEDIDRAEVTKLHGTLADANDELKKRVKLLRETYKTSRNK